MKLTPQKIRMIVIGIALFLTSGGIGYWLGTRDVQFSWANNKPHFTVINTSVPQDKDVDFSLFWEVWNKLEQEYIDKEKIDYEKMVYGAISGMTRSLDDPYTVFLPPEQNEEARESLNGAFEGIGAQLGMKEERIVVVAPLKGTPAEQAGIRAGDWIVKVNDEETSGWSVPEAVEKIRGPKGEKVVLNIYRDGDEKPQDITVVRGTIVVPTVETEMKDNVGVLKLYQFGDRTNEEWNKGVTEVMTSCFSAGTLTCDGVILDLRNNPGGYLQGSVFIASEFLKDGVVVIQEHASGRRDTLSVDRQGTLTEVPLVVLINEGSASASEIVAGALRVRGRATLVGEKTFGKGSVQERLELPGKAGLHITTARWLLPDETWINSKGVSPDIEVADDPETKEVDEQLEKAIEVVKTL